MESLSAPNFDPIEVARGILASLSFSSENIVHEVHTTRIQNIFFRSGISKLTLKPTLEALNDLREVERLEYGYWLPSPSRTVSLDSKSCLLISIAPTIELKRHFQSVRRAGLGRIADTRQVIGLPSQSLKSWLGTGDMDTETWARTQIESVFTMLKPSITSSDLKVYGIQTTRGFNRSSKNAPVWLPCSDRRAIVWNDVKLFRSRVSGYQYRYFLGQIKANSWLLEGPSVQDNLRLQYGLAALLGQPLTSTVVSKGDLYYLRMPLAVPSSSRRALNALCEPDLKSLGYLWKCRKVDCWPIVKTILYELGCEIEKDE